MQTRQRTAPASSAMNGVRAVRPSSEEIDERILDVAAGVFARFGYAQASVQRIADETGYSKSGLLHRFGSKEQLRDAARERSLAPIGHAITPARTRTPGPDRDREVVAALVDLALERPGFVALLLSGGTQPRSQDTAWVHDEVKALLDAGFAMDDATPLARRMRVLGCLGTLGIGVAATGDYPTHEVRTELQATCHAALGL